MEPPKDQPTIEPPLTKQEFEQKFSRGIRFLSYHVPEFVRSLLPKAEHLETVLEGVKVQERIKDLWASAPDKTNLPYESITVVDSDDSSVFWRISYFPRTGLDIKGIPHKEQSLEIAKGRFVNNTPYLKENEFDVRWRSGLWHAVHREGNPFLFRNNSAVNKVVIPAWKTITSFDITKKSVLSDTQTQLFRAAVRAMDNALKLTDNVTSVREEKVVSIYWSKPWREEPKPPPPKGTPLKVDQIHIGVGRFAPVSVSGDNNISRRRR